MPTSTPSAIHRGIESGYVKNPIPDLSIGFFGFLPLTQDFDCKSKQFTVHNTESGHISKNPVLTRGGGKLFIVKWIPLVMF